MFWIYLLMALIWLVVAFIAWRFPPQNINYLYGYRTPRALKNEANWRYAQALMPPMFLRSALYMVLAAGLSYFIDFTQWGEMIFFLAVLLLSLMGELLYSENKLKKFDQSHS